MSSAFGSSRQVEGHGPHAGRRRLARRPVVVSTLVLLPAVLAACGSRSAPDPAQGTIPSSRAPGDGAGSSVGGAANAVKDFRLVTYQGEAVLGGRETTFANVFARGKPVVLNFWAGLCPPCRAEMPAFQKVADELQDKFILVGVDVGPFIGLGSREDARRLLRELNIRYPAAAAADATPLRLYNVRNMPTTVFLNAKGQVVETANGLLVERQLRSKVEHLVAASL